jgi:hypothetical protein
LVLQVLIYKLKENMNTTNKAGEVQKISTAFWEVNFYDQTRPGSVRAVMCVMCDSRSGPQPWLLEAIWYSVVGIVRENKSRYLR